MSDPEDDEVHPAEMVDADEQARWVRHRRERPAVGSTTALAMVNLRELARKTEEAAVILEGAGYQTLPGELLRISERLIEIREALERLSGRAR
jgi:hypothetical protein